MKCFKLPCKFLLTTALMSVVAVAPHAVHAQTLNDAVSKAVSNHPEVEAAQASLGITEHDISEQRSGYFPEISATATGGRIYGDNSTSRGLSTTRGAGYSYLWEGSVTARQMVFDAFETQNRIASARASEKSAMLDLANVREGLALRAVQAYVNVLRARTGYKMVRDYKASVESYLGRIKTLVDEGAADEAELQQARDVKIILQNFEADYRGQIKAAESDYAELTGGVPNGALAVPAAPVDMVPVNIDEAIAAVKSEHTLIRGAHMAAQASKHNIAAEKAGYYPDVNGELSFMKSDKDDVIGGEVEDGKAVIRMNWAFETGGAQNARVNKKRLEHKTALARVKVAERQIEREVRLAYAEKETAQSQYKNQKLRLDLNQKLFDTYKTQFEGAVVSLLQVMQADNQLFNAKLEAMNAEHRFLLSQYAALASVGRLQKAVMSAPQDITQ